MAAFLDIVRFNPTTGGTTDWTFSTAVTGYQSPALAGVVNGTLYKYRAESADLTQWELGEGAYNTGTGVLPRTTVLYNSAGTGTGAGQSGAGTKINFTLTPQVAIVALKEDLISIQEANSFTNAQKAQALTNIRVSQVTIQRLTSGTGATYTTATGATWIRIKCRGGGSGGGGGNSGTNSTAGTATTFSGGTLSAGGGGVANNQIGGGGGGASGGNVDNIVGQGGGAPTTSEGGTVGIGGNGGGEGGGQAMNTTGVNGAANTGGGGGGGAVSNAVINVTGGAGGGQGGYVEHIITGPAATYTYTIGPGGAGAAGGTSGSAGGTGGSGVIIVEEYYN